MPGEDGTRRALAEYLYHLGKNAQRCGEPDRARAALAESLLLADLGGDFRGTAIALIRLGCIEEEAGRHERAAVFYGAAKKLADPDHVTPWPPFDEPDYEKHVAAVKASLDEDAFARAADRGRTMTVGDFVAMVREPS